MERMKAKWIKKVEHGCYWYICSCCKEEVSKNNYGHDYFSQYCPSCGCKMEDIDFGEEYE